MSSPAEMFLKHVANVIAERSTQYGDASRQHGGHRQRVGRPRWVGRSPRRRSSCACST